MAQRDKIGCPLRAHDAGQLSDRAWIALFRPAPGDGGECRFVHSHARACGRAALRFRFAPDVHHAGAAGVVEMRKA